MLIGYYDYFCQFFEPIVIPREFLRIYKSMAQEIVTTINNPDLITDFRMHFGGQKMNRYFFV